MKKDSNILRYPIMLITFIVVLVLLDVMFGKAVERSFWFYFIQGGAFLLAVSLANVAEKHGWDTWSDLINKFKKNK